MFAFVSLFCSVDCDHQGSVVSHNCTPSYMSYGTEVVFQSSDVVCTVCVLFCSACCVKLTYCLFIHAFLCHAAVLGGNTVSPSKSVATLTYAILVIYYFYTKKEPQVFISVNISFCYLCAHIFNKNSKAFTNATRRNNIPLKPS